MSSRKRTAHVERHVRLYHRMMKTAAWRSLSCHARCIYIEIERRYGGPGSNNGKIHYPVREAGTDCNISKTTAANGLLELQERGFIRIERRGAFSLKTRHATEFRLTAITATSHTIWPLKNTSAGSRGARTPSKNKTR